MQHHATMWPYYPDLLEAHVPRYTSYPTAAEFHDGVGPREMAEALDTIEIDQPISLYVHIPYCREICWYCGCNTGAAGKAQRLTSYLTALETEVAMIAGKLGGRGRVKHIAFGGGSPNAIAPIEFVRLVDRVLTMFSCDAPKISVEIDPRTFSHEWASVLAQCGVSRVSLGIQSFAETIQRAIGRIQPRSMVDDCVAKLRSVGIDALNFDLMYGLPGQSTDDLHATLDASIDLAPSRIALFGYAHMPHLFPRQRRIDGQSLPGSAKRFAMAWAGYEQLTDAGYAAIGFDHFARPSDSLAIAAANGRLRRNFQGFTDDNCTVTIGLGASAISIFPGHVVQNQKNPGQYRMLASSANFAAARGIQRSDEDRLRGSLIENLLCTGKSGPLTSGLLKELTPRVRVFAERRLARIAAENIVIEADGLPYARAIASLLDQYRGAASKQFSPTI